MQSVGSSPSLKIPRAPRASRHRVAARQARPVRLASSKDASRDSFARTECGRIHLLLRQRRRALAWFVLRHPIRADLINVDAWCEFDANTANRTSDHRRPFQRREFRLFGPIAPVRRQLARRLYDAHTIDDRTPAGTSAKTTGRSAARGDPGLAAAGL